MESLCTALKNIDRADIVTALEAPQPSACSSEEGACRLSNRDSALLSPSFINGKHTAQSQTLVDPGDPPADQGSSSDHPELRYRCLSGDVVSPVLVHQVNLFSVSCCC